MKCRRQPDPCARWISKFETQSSAWRPKKWALLNANGCTSSSSESLKLERKIKSRCQTWNRHFWNREGGLFLQGTQSFIWNFQTTIVFGPTGVCRRIEAIESWNKVWQSTQITGRFCWRISNKKSSHCKHTWEKVNCRAGERASVCEKFSLKTAIVNTDSPGPASSKIRFQIESTTREHGADCSKQLH